MRVRAGTGGDTDTHRDAADNRRPLTQTNDILGLDLGRNWASNFAILGLNLEGVGFKFGHFGAVCAGLSARKFGNFGAELRWPLQPLQPFQKTRLQPPFGPSVDSLCHPCITPTTCLLGDHSHPQHPHGQHHRRQHNYHRIGYQLALTQFYSALIGPL